MAILTLLSPCLPTSTRPAIHVDHADVDAASGDDLPPVRIENPRMGGSLGLVVPAPDGCDIRTEGSLVQLVAELAVGSSGGSQLNGDHASRSFQPGVFAVHLDSARAAGHATIPAGHTRTTVTWIIMVVRRRRLAAELRRLRETAHLTLEEAAARLECSPSKISRIETGHVLVSPRDVRDLLRIYGVPDSEQASLIELARETRQKGWWQSYGSSIEPHLATYLSLEHDASEMRIYRVSRVPGLLQSSEYAHAFFSAERPGAVHPGIEQSVTLLSERQRQAATSPPGLQVVLGEAALRQQPGGPEALRGQIEHMIRLSSQPGTTIQVIPFTSAGLHVTIDGNFTIMGFPHDADPDIVCIGYPTGLLWVEDTAEVAHYDVLFRQLQAAALSAEDTRTLMASLLADS